MRNALSAALAECAGDPRFVFLTGDLGFGALEPLQDALGPRFINAGVAEQNMVSVAAGLARSGLSPWIYSIAPFVYARPFEQVRNDVCLHDLPVRIVGNGGGYGYGVMGSTHHAIEDYGALLCLDHLRAFIPAFSADVMPITRRLADFPHPAYLRLGRCEKPAGLELPEYAPWRCLLDGDGPTMVIAGPLAGGILAELAEMDQGVRPSVWVVTELPFVVSELPAAFLADLQRSNHLFVVEEHVAAGGAGEKLAHGLLEAGLAPAQFTHRCAQGYPSGTYGSQNFHRCESGIDAESVAAAITEIAATRRTSYRIRKAA